MRARLLAHWRIIRYFDAGMAVWTAAWIALGVLVGLDVEGLSRLADTVGAAGSALEATGKVISGLSHIPFTGLQLGDLADQLQQAAHSAQSSGVTTRKDVHELAIVLGVAVGAVPTLPLLVLYAPLRLGWRRDVETVRAAHARVGDDPYFREFLARRALQHMPYRDTLAITENPWRDIAEGRTEALARAELRRLGIEHPPRGG